MSDTESRHSKRLFFCTELSHAYELFVAAGAVRRQIDRQVPYYYPDRTEEQLVQRKALLTIAASMIEVDVDKAVDSLCARWQEIRS